MPLLFCRRLTGTWMAMERRYGSLWLFGLFPLSGTCEQAESLLQAQTG